MSHQHIAYRNTGDHAIACRNTSILLAAILAIPAYCAAMMANMLLLAAIPAVACRNTGDHAIACRDTGDHAHDPAGDTTGDRHRHAKATLGPRTLAKAAATRIAGREAWRIMMMT